VEGIGIGQVGDKGCLRWQEARYGVDLGHVEGFLNGVAGEDRRRGVGLGSFVGIFSSLEIVPSVKLSLE
jgi:hypothetical protein